MFLRLGVQEVHKTHHEFQARKRASRPQYPNQHPLSNYLVVPGEEGQKWLSQDCLWDCIWVPVTPPLPSPGNPIPRRSSNALTGRESRSSVAQPPRPSTTNQRFAQRMVIFASVVGYMARKEFEEHLAAVRELQQQAAPNGNVLSSSEMPVVGSYVTPLRQHVSGSDAGPSSASNLPPGLTLNRVISDYLRAMGNFILRHLQEVHFRSDLSMEDVQWCVTVPSI